MALKDFKKFELSTDELNKFQDNVSNFLRQFNSEFLDGQLVTTPNGSVIEGIAIDTVSTNVPHGLGRAYRGWILIDKTGSANVWRDATSTADSAKFLPLIASSAVTIKLWVF